METIIYNDGQLVQKMVYEINIRLIIDHDIEILVAVVQFLF
jgi:hypothetical protein